MFFYSEGFLCSTFALKCSPVHGRKTFQSCFALCCKSSCDLKTLKTLALTFLHGRSFDDYLINVSVFITMFIIMIIAEQINSGAFLFTSIYRISSIYRIPSHCHHQLEASLSPSVLHQHQHPASRIPNSSSEVGVQKTPRLVVNIIIIFFVIIINVSSIYWVVCSLQPSPSCSARLLHNFHFLFFLT